MSTGFNFGSKPAAPAFGSGFGFGQNAPQAAAPAFGSTAPTSQPAGFQQANTLSFKPAGTSGFGGFGAPASAANTGFGFGSTPATSAPASGFGFGGAPNAAPFGATASTAPSTGFGGFGATATTAAPAFGSSFGTPASSAPLGFGATATPAFGATTTSAPTSGFGFGTVTSAPAAGTTFGFGAPATTSAGGFGLGAPTSAPATGGLGFGATTTPATGLTFGATTSAPTALSFGAPPTAATSGGLSFGVAPTAPSTGLTFGTSTTAPTLNLGGTTTSVAGGTALNFGTTPTTGLSFGLGTLATTSTATATSGLGGIASSSQTKAGTTVTTTQKEVPPKEQPIPNEIQQDVENLKTFIKQQKIHSSDVARCSVKEFRSVETQITTLNNVLNEVESQLQKNRTLVEKLKYDTANGLQLLEMAQRTQDLPPGLQYENTAPVAYFLNLADQFEKEMQALKIQIENTEKYVKNFGQPATLTSQDLSLGMRRLHDTFVALAGRLQSVHTQVESQKESYINLKKHVTNDPTNPFEKLSNQPVYTIQQVVLKSPPKIACGPTPFSNLVNTSNFSMSSQQNQIAPGFSTVTTTAAPGFGFSNNTFGGQPATTSLFGSNNTSFGQSPFQLNTSSGFQLQKPPTGSKRGKQ